MMFYPPMWVQFGLPFCGVVTGSLIIIAAQEAKRREGGEPDHVADRVVSGIVGSVKWVAQSVVQLAPPAFKWTAVAVVAGFASVTIMASAFFVSIGSDSDIILGVMDRAQVMQEKAHEQELELISAERSRLDAELLNLSGTGDLRYCMTKDSERLYLDMAHRQPDFWLD